MTAVKFIDAPPPIENAGGGGRRGSKFLPIANVLKENPGRWAEVHSHVSQSSAQQLKRTGSGAFLPLNEWEITTRRVPDPGYEGGDGHSYSVYARYVGPHADLVPDPDDSPDLDE